MQFTAKAITEVDVTAHVRGHILGNRYLSYVKNTLQISTLDQVSLVALQSVKNCGKCSSHKLFDTDQLAVM